MEVIQALEVVASNTRSEEFVKRQTFEITDWKCGQHLTNHRLHNSMIGVVDAEMVSKLLRDAHSVDIMKATLGSLLESVNKLQDAFKKHVDPVIAKLSKGFASLPDELIAPILNYACVEIGTKQAVWLSHVSRGFRRIALSEADLWTTLHSHAHPDEIEAYISRSREADLNVVAKITPDDYDEDLRPFFTACFNLASRLKSFRITADLDDYTNPFNLALSNKLMDPDDGKMPVVLPHLEELDIFQYKEGDDDLTLDNYSFGDFSPSWDAPALRTIRCRNYIPAPTASAFAAITSFSLFLSLRSGIEVEPFQWLLEFLESTPTLQEFDVEMVDAEHFATAGPITNAITCPSLVSLQLRISSLRIPQATEIILAPFMESLHMPKLDRLSFSAELDYKSLVIPSNSDHSDFISPVVEALLPDPLDHTRLTSLSIAITSQMPNKFQVMGLHSSTIPSKRLVIPLDRMPFVKVMSLTTSFHTTFTGDKSERPSGRGSYQPNRSCALREVRLRSCHYMTIWQLQQMVQSLKEFGVWDALEKFVIEDCASVTLDRALEIIGPERLTYARNFA
ncbi:hypothetical protein SCHPADRAFT_941254 [Schizopora paradoxa]|uniref:Uncharacterized protein n=1 Tax=Schizopora paradoxa TaxID=27342 RepID=A0A0H2RLJ9_9AGAM|nr:hypothetical protein SCHPADRAFT_941254 [Schizopora paradoxa]